MTLSGIQWRALERIVKADGWISLREAGISIYTSRSLQALGLVKHRLDSLGVYVRATPQGRILFHDRKS